MRTERFDNLYHGTDEESKKLILANGFKLSTDDGLWCGPGIYFYDIKSKAWWYASNKCADINHLKKIKVNPAIIKAHIRNIEKKCILDLRDPKELEAFEQAVSPVLDEAKGKMVINGYRDSEYIIKIRSALISYYADFKEKTIIIGYFRQRPQPKIANAIAVADSIDMIVGIECIYCIKDETIIEIAEEEYNEG